MLCGKHLGVFLDSLERLAVAVREVLATQEGKSMSISAAMAVALTDAERSHEEVLLCDACREDYERLRTARI